MAKAGVTHSEAVAQKVYDIAYKDRAFYASASFLEKCYSGRLILSTIIMKVRHFLQYVKSLNHTLCPISIELLVDLR